MQKFQSFVYVKSEILIIIKVTVAHAAYLHNDYGNKIKKENKRLYDVNVITEISRKLRNILNLIIEMRSIVYSLF